MKIYLYLVIIFIASTAMSKGEKGGVELELDGIYSFMKSNPDSAISLALDLKERSEKSSDYYGIVKTNFTIGYLLDVKKSDYGKAIIYYLEAIRYAKEHEYEDRYKDLAVLHKNCGVIFRKFKSYLTAEEYYAEAMNYAEGIKNTKEIRSINFNTAGLLMDQKQYEQAIEILNNLIINAKVDTKNYWKYNNRLGIALFESEKYDLAIDAHNNSLKYSSLSDKLYAYTIHNIGRCYSALNDFKNAYSYFEKALDLKKKLEDNTVLFSTYAELGDLNYKKGDIERSLYFYNNAEKHIDELTDLNHYELYKSKADALFKLKRFNDAKEYEDMYADRLNGYLEQQAEIQSTDKRYNIDLITKRYFAEVKKQEQIANILLVSKIVSGSLLALLLLTIGYNWYQKVQLRKSIVQDLINLKVVD